MDGAHVSHFPPAPMAPAWSAVCGLPAACSWIWLARPGAIEAASALGLVLLQSLPGLLVTIGAEISGHG